MKVSACKRIVFFALALWVSNGLAAQGEQADTMEESNVADPQSEVQENSTEVEGFVTKIGNEIINILVHKSQPLDARKKMFRSILDRDFDMPTIGKFVIARYWRGMSDDQQKEYIHLFVSAVVENYASQFDNYNNEKLVVNNARKTEDGGYLVHSSITRPGKGQPLRVDWKIFKTPRGIKVLDVVVDGVSMSITLRSEYSAVFSSRGGVDGLLEYLREKSTEKSKASEASAT